MESLLELRNEPFCAGVTIFDNGRLLFALSTEEAWTADGTQIKIPVQSVGGGMEAGENMLECAIREAKEEIGVEVEIVHSPITYFQDENGNSMQVILDEDPAPICYQRRISEQKTPYKSGLPAGDILHLGLYIAHLKGKPKPVDIPAFIWVPLDQVSVLFDGIDLRNLPLHNIDIVTKKKLPANAHFYFPESCTEKMLHDVLTQHGGSLFSESTFSA